MGYRKYYSSKILLLVLTASIIPILGMSVQDSTADIQKFFTGLGDGTSWSDPNNWDPTGIPASIDAVIIDCGSILSELQLDVDCPFVVNMDIPYTAQNAIFVGGDDTLNTNEKLTHDGNTPRTITLIGGATWNINDEFVNLSGSIFVAEGANTINNFGTFDMQSGLLQMSCCDNSFNNHEIFTTGDATIELTSSSASFNNFGFFTLNDPGFVDMRGTFTNDATVTNNKGEIDEKSESFDFVKTGDDVFHLFSSGGATVASPVESLHSSFIILIIATIVFSLGIAFIMIGIFMKQKGKI